MEGEVEDEEEDQDEDGILSNSPNSKLASTVTTTPAVFEFATLIKHKLAAQVIDVDQDWEVCKITSKEVISLVEGDLRRRE